MTPRTRPSRRTGIDSTRTGTSSRHSGSPSRTIRPSSSAASSRGRRPRGTRWPTMSSWYEVGPVLGRIWATETYRVPSRVGTHRTRSANERSDSSCHSETSRCSHSRSESSSAVCWRTSLFMEGTCVSVPGGMCGSSSPVAGGGGRRDPRTGLENTRGPRRLRGTLNPPGTAARSNIGRGVCGPGRPKDEDPGQSGQRAPVPPSVLLCGEDGSSLAAHERFARWVHVLIRALLRNSGLDHSGVSMRWRLFVVVSSGGAATACATAGTSCHPPRTLTRVGSCAGPVGHGDLRDRLEFRAARAVARLLGHALDDRSRVPGERGGIGAGGQLPRGDARLYTTLERGD